jgi:hypothetical protein
VTVYPPAPLGRKVHVVPATPVATHFVVPQLMGEGPLGAIRTDCPAGTFFSVAVMVPVVLTLRDDVMVSAGGAGLAVTRSEVVWVPTTRPL